MKKCLIVYLAVSMMIATLLPAGAVTDKATLSINAPTKLPLYGEMFEVAVNITDNPGFCAIQYNLSYDDTEMECISVETGEVLKRSLSATNPNATAGPGVAAASLNSIKEEGVLTIYLFKAKKDVTEFNFNLKNVILSDENGEDINYQIVGAANNQGNGPVSDNEKESETEPIPETGGKNEDVKEDSQDTSALENQPSNPGANQENENLTETNKQEPNQGPDLDAAAGEDYQEHVFADVAGNWAESFINEATKFGLFKGGADGKFNPDDNVTRAQFVTVLWRMAGSPEVSAKVPFTDIDNQIVEFKSAIAWGYANGYINGTSYTTFDPSGTLTREAGMKILHYYSGGKIGGELQLQAIYDGTFKDSSEISQWAKNSIYWGVYNKLISGTGATTLSPRGTATRAQLAKILVNYINYIQTN